jgi:hypothetical protein
MKWVGLRRLAHPGYLECDTSPPSRIIRSPCHRMLLRKLQSERLNRRIDRPNGNGSACGRRTMSSESTSPPPRYSLAGGPLPTRRRACWVSRGVPFHNQTSSRGRPSGVGVISPRQGSGRLRLSPPSPATPLLSTQIPCEDRANHGENTKIRCWRTSLHPGLTKSERRQDDGLIGFLAESCG